MEAVRLFLLKIILVAIMVNVMANSQYKTISLSHSTNQDRTPMNSYSAAQKRNWVQRSSTADMYKNMPPYLVLNKKTGAYHPYYKFPSLRRMATLERQWNNYKASGALQQRNLKSS